MRAFTRQAGSPSRLPAPLVVCVIRWEVLGRKGRDKISIVLMLWSWTNLLLDYLVPLSAKQDQCSPLWVLGDRLDGGAGDHRVLL